MIRAQLPGKLGRIVNIRLILWILVIGLMESAVQTASASPTVVRGPIEIEQALSWLPADTETLLVANGPFWISSHETAQQGAKNSEVTTEELESRFEGLTLSLFNSSNGPLKKHLEGRKVRFALEASRHFRLPADLGELPFEGCAIAIFDDNLDDRRDAFMKDAAHLAVDIAEIDGQKVAVFQEPLQDDLWTTFVAFPQKGVVLVATDQRLLEQVLARMKDAKGRGALPDCLPEWKYVNRHAQFWGFRHFDKLQAKDDPTSPFGVRKFANVPDDQAIGLTYQCTPSKERKVILTYLSGSKTEIRKIEQARFTSSSHQQQAAGLHLQYRELEPGVIRSTCDVSRSEPLEWFIRVLLGNMGHAIYI
jgi:hypothetical protein